MQLGGGLFCLSSGRVRLLNPECSAPSQDGRTQQLRENNVLAVNTKKRTPEGEVREPEQQGHGPAPVREFHKIRPWLRRPRLLCLKSSYGTDNKAQRSNVTAS